jgi:hypothetical protein
MDRSSVQLVCSSYSGTSASDAERRVVNHTVVVLSVPPIDSPLIPPLFIRSSINFYIARQARKKAKIAKIKTAHLKSLLNVRSVYPGNLSARTARSLETHVIGRVS